MAYAYSHMSTKNVANSATDRILKLTPIPGKGRDSTGLIDKRIFTGENKLHAVQDSGLWYLKYEMGAVPGALNQKFTNFNQLLKFVTSYFKSRNIDVVEVID